MSIKTKTSFANELRGQIYSLLPWSRRLCDVRPEQNLSQRFSIPSFDTEIEQQFCNELQAENLSTLKTTILLGSVYFFAYMTFALISGEFSKSETMALLLIVLTPDILFFGFFRHYTHENIINRVAKFCAVIWVLGPGYLLLVKDNHDFYTQIWVGLLPIYFFTYGQMFMSISEAVKFGLWTMIALPLSGYLIGVETMALMQSMLILPIINALGFCSRRQLEVYARNLFIERRKAEQSSEETKLFIRQLGHNCRQPLNALSCYVSVLDAVFADKQSEYDKQINQVAGKLGLAIDNLNSTFNRIIDIASLRVARSQQTCWVDCLIMVVGNLQKLKHMTDQFTAWGCRVQQAASKAEFDKVLAENVRPPDLLICYFYLDNEETAHDIIAAIQADCGLVPTLILSAYAVPDKDKAKWPENTLLLRMPTSETVLMEMMIKAMENHSNGTTINSPPPVDQTQHLFQTP
jgi:signal transduction histidine kinase